VGKGLFLAFFYRISTKTLKLADFVRQPTYFLSRRRQKVGKKRLSLLGACATWPS